MRLTLRQLLVLVLGFAVALAGAKLRWDARSRAWSQASPFDGPREETAWWDQEQAYQDFGRIALVFGSVLIVGVILQWSRPRG